MDLLGWNPSYKRLKLYIPRWNIEAVYPSNGLPPSMMALWEMFKSNTKTVSWSLLNIRSYLLSAQSYMWHSHVIIFVALNSVGKKSTFPLLLVVILLAWVCHNLIAFFPLEFWNDFSTIIVELHLLYTWISRFKTLPRPYAYLYKSARLGCALLLLRRIGSARHRCPCLSRVTKASTKYALRLWLLRLYGYLSDSCHVGVDCWIPPQVKATLPCWTPCDPPCAQLHSGTVLVSKIHQGLHKGRSLSVPPAFTWVSVWLPSRWGWFLDIPASQGRFTTLDALRRTTRTGSLRHYLGFKDLSRPPPRTTSELASYIYAGPCLTPFTSGLIVGLPLKWRPTHHAGRLATLHARSLTQDSSWFQRVTKASPILFVLCVDACWL